MVVPPIAASFEASVKEALNGLGHAPADTVVTALVIGFFAWFLVRYVFLSFFTVDQNERAVITSFGRAKRLIDTPSVEGTDPSRGQSRGQTPQHALEPTEQDRYLYPQVRVLGPGGPYFKWPWQQVHKVSVATRTVNMAWDPEDPTANHGGQMLEAVTKDQLNTGLTGQIRYRISESHLYAFLFAVKNPIAHVMGFFISILRERIANFEAKAGEGAVVGVSINDLRKNLRDLNERMDQEAAPSATRYGIILDASLITGIDPPSEVESALAAINTAHNLVSSDISLAQAGADQKIVQSRRAVEIETLRAHTEVEPLQALADQLSALKAVGGSAALSSYVRNVRLALHAKARRAFMEVRR